MDQAQLNTISNFIWNIADYHGKQVATHLYGQEINAETYAICKADILAIEKEAEGLLGDIIGEAGR
jgi:type I restriction-modification system DNA methylase subunit